MFLFFPCSCLFDEVLCTGIFPFVIPCAGILLFVMLFSCGMFLVRLFSLLLFLVVICTGIKFFTLPFVVAHLCDLPFRQNYFSFPIYYEATYEPDESCTNRKFNSLLLKDKTGI